MPQNTIPLPENFSFSTLIPIRITDLNYGNHVGNDTMLSLIHEARMQYLAALGMSELNLGGPGIIMRDVSIQYKSEVFYGDMIKISVAVIEFTNSGFTMVYKLEKSANNQIVAYARTGLVCYDYDRKKVCRLPVEAKKKMEQLKG